MKVSHGFTIKKKKKKNLLHILELGYSVMYNDVDMVWLADPFPYLQGSQRCVLHR